MAPESLLPSQWDVPEIFRRRLGQAAGRQRAMADGGHLLLVLHRPPKPEQIEREGRFFWRSPDGRWRSSELERGRTSIDKHIEEHRKLIHELEAREEAATEARELFSILQQLTPLQRAIRHMSEALQRARELCPDARDVIDLRDRSEVVARSAELLLAEAKITLEFTIAQGAEEQAATAREMAVSAHKLNALAAFFFPIMTLTAVFGTNLIHGFEEAHAPWPFVATIGVGLVLGWMLKASVTRTDPSRDDTGSG